VNDTALAAFGTEYARHRQTEGRAYKREDLFALPYLRHGPLARQWSVRVRSFDAFKRRALRPLAARLGRALTLLDLGAGNGWLSYRATLEGHRAIALDIRDDAVDGLGAAALLEQSSGGRMTRLVASFASIPMADASVDLAVFNASLHYALDLSACLAEAARVVRPGGLLAIVDSPFYRRDEDGRAMVAEKRAQAAVRFGDRADALLALPFIEYLTRQSLQDASNVCALDWRRHRVRYPLWYELRPLLAALRGRRAPSRFDLWIAARP
jgi:SAM-dependent methyltransferase